MHTLNIDNLRKIKKAIPVIERKIKIRISVNRSGQVKVAGKEVDEFVVCKILQAVDFGFDVGDALILQDENFCLEFINIKEFTQRKNLRDVRSRVIGRKGKAKKTMEELTGARIVIHGNSIGIIVDSEHLDSAVQAVISLIQGTKHGAVFSYLEKQNKNRRGFGGSGLGLKQKFKR